MTSLYMDAEVKATDVIHINPSISLREHSESRNLRGKVTEKFATRCKDLRGA